MPSQSFSTEANNSQYVVTWDNLVTAAVLRVDGERIGALSDLADGRASQLSTETASGQPITFRFVAQRPEPNVSVSIDGVELVGGPISDSNPISVARALDSATLSCWGLAAFTLVLALYAVRTNGLSPMFYLAGASAVGLAYLASRAKIDAAGSFRVAATICGVVGFFIVLATGSRSIWGALLMLGLFGALVYVFWRGREAALGHA